MRPSPDPDRHPVPRLLAAAVFAATISFAIDAGAAEKLAIQPKFAAVGHFHEGLAPAMEDGRWGFIDRNGEWVVEPTYEAVLAGADGRFGVRRDGNWGYINSVGRLVIEPQYDDAQAFSDGVAAVESGGRWGYISPLGATAIPFIYDRATPREAGFAFVRIAEHWGVVDRLGRFQDFYSASAPVDIAPLSDGMAVAAMPDGSVAFLTLYDAPIGLWDRTILKARSFSEGLAAVSFAKNRWQYLTKDGELAFSQTFGGARDFSQGVAPVMQKGKWGYVDKRGQMVLRPTYDAAYSFNEGYAVVREGTARGFLKIDAGGKISAFVAPRFEDVFRFQEGLAPVKVGGLWGFLGAEKAGAEQEIRGVAEIYPE